MFFDSDQYSHIFSDQNIYKLLYYKIQTIFFFQIILLSLNLHPYMKNEEDLKCY